MANVTSSKVSWNAGILSNLLSGRFNIDQYTAGGEVIENFIPLLQGPLLKRPGTAYVTTTPGPEYLIEFKFDNKQQFVLGFGNGYIRFYNRAGIVETSPGSGVPYQVASPYAFGDIVNSDGYLTLQYVQSADVIYLVHPKYQPRTLTRFASNNWVLSTLDFKGGPFDPINTTNIGLNPSASTGNISITATAPLFAPTDVGRLVQIQTPPTDLTAPWSPGMAITAGTYILSNGKTYFSLNSGTTGAVAPNHTAGVLRDGNNGIQWRYLHAGYGVVKITAYGTPTFVTGVVQLRIPDQALFAPTNTNWNLGSLSETTGWPSHVDFYRERLSLLRGVDVFLSVSGDYTDFSALDASGLVVADRAISGQLQGSELNKGTWLKGGDTLLIGTLGAEFSMGPENQNQPFGPNNAKITQKSSYGSTNVRPVLVQNQILYVQRSGRRVREVLETESAGYSNLDLSKLSLGIVDSDIVSMAYQEEPYQVIWIALKSGILLGITYDKSEGVYGWHKHILGTF